MDNCIFCKIANGSIPSKKVYEDDVMLAFEDISPMAPVHILIIPKQHIQSVDFINEDNSSIIARIFETIPKIAKKAGIADDGYRIISNHGENGRQTVKHLHFHMLGGKELNADLA